MNTGTIGMVAGVAGFFLGGWAVFVATDAQRDVADVKDVSIQDQESMDALADQYRGLQESIQGARKGLGELRADEQQLRGVVRDLIARLEAVEKKLERVRAGGGGGTPESAGIGTGGGDDDERAAKRRFEELRLKVFDGTATDDEEAAFWELARTTGAVDDLIRELEAAFERNPRDADAAFRLAGAYTAKLLTVPNGPERGAWAAKGEGVYRSLLEQDPDNWQARYSLAFSLSQWPPFMGKSQEAIDQFEQLRALQARSTPDAGHTRTYLQLSELYRSKGNLEKAREVLADGAERHPDSQAIKDALAHLSGAE